VKHLVIVDVSVRVLFPAVILGSLWLLLAGHNQPGGGFVGGIVAGAAVATRYVAGGIDEVRSISPVRPWTVLGAGLLVAAVTATIPIVLGHDVLEAASAQWDLPVIGRGKTTSALAFDIGVYLIVLGLVLMIFESFGDDLIEDREVSS